MAATPKAAARRSYPGGVTPEERQARAKELGEQAEIALAAGDDWAANELVRLRRLVLDGGRDADELLAEGMALNRIAAHLAGPRTR